MAGKRKALPTEAVTRRRRWRKKGERNSSILLVWSQRIVPLFQVLSKNVTREVSSYIAEPSFLPGVRDNRIYIVNVLTGTFRFVPIPSSFDSFFIQIDGLTAAFVTSMDKKLDVYIVDYLALTLTDLNLDLSGGRISADRGCYIQNTLCLFHATNDEFARNQIHLTTLHKYSFNARKWTSSSSYDFEKPLASVVPHKNRVYLLFGSYPGKHITYQTYDLDTDELSVINEINTKNLIDDWVLSRWCPSVSLGDDLLYCLSHKHNPWTWDFHQNATFEALKTQNLYHFRTQGVTVFRGQELYWMELMLHKKSNVYSFNIQTHLRVERQLQL